MGGVSWYKLMVYILLSAKRRAYFCQSIAIEMGGVSRHFSKVSGSGVDWILLIEWGVVWRKNPLNKGTSTENMVHEPNFLAYELQLLWHTNPDFYAIWAVFIWGGGGLNYIEYCCDRTALSPAPDVVEVWPVQSVWHGHACNEGECILWITDKPRHHLWVCDLFKQLLLGSEKSGQIAKRQ